MAGLRVYYNSRCPVCDAGIAGQRAKMLARAPAEAVDWRDINQEPEALQWCGAQVNDVRRKLYVIDEDGGVHVGADAFVLLAKRTPGQRWLGHVFGLPVLVSLARIAYNGFAALLYGWNRRNGRW